MRESVGVIIARFQVPELHIGHRYLIESVIRNHKDVLIILGQSPVQFSDRNPLNFETRKAMLNSAYPDILVASNNDSKSNQIWSDNIDAIIETHFPGQEAILYGSRKSFVDCYLGKFKTQVIDEIPAPTGTDLRNGVKVIDSSDFRRGVIYASRNRFPISYQTVDVAIVDRYRNKVLLGLKNHDSGKGCFIGGFVDPADESLERAAKREATEETNFMETDCYRYLGSVKVNDWRYHGKPDSVMTAFFVADYIFGALRPGDDLDGLKWVSFEELSSAIIEEHKPLAKMLLEHLLNSTTRS